MLKAIFTWWNGATMGARFDIGRRAALVGLASAASSARAQTADFPDRPLRLIVGFPPGGPNDLLARVIAPGIGIRGDIG